MKWFRMWNEAIDDDKLRMLAFEDRWHFVAVLCCKAQGILDDAKLLDRRVAVKLGLGLSEADEVKRRLVEVGLINEAWQPVAWGRRQFDSDDSYTRVKKHRANKKRFRNVSETPPDTDTDTDTDTENSGSSFVSESISSKGGSTKRVSTRARKAKPPGKTTIPEGFALSERVQAWAAQKGFDRLDDHLETFRLKAASKGYQYADWDAAFMTAVREDWAGLRNGKAYHHTTTRQPTKQDRYLDSLHKLTGGLAGKSMDNNTGDYGNVIDISAAATRLG